MVAVVSFALALSACSGGGSSIQPSVIPESAASSGVTVAPAIAQAEVRTAPLRTAVETGEASGEQARSADTFVDSIGLNTHLNWGIYHSNYPAVKAALLELGVRHIREALTLKPVPGVLDRLRDLAGAGIHTILSTDIKDDPDAIAAYAANYYPSIEAFEGPNEQNGVGDDWAPRLRAFTKNLYRAVKNNSATARYPVLGPPLDSAANGSRDFSILGDLSAYMDEGDLHDYSGGWMPDTKFIASQIALEKVVSGNRPIVASEDGYCTATTGQSVSLETQMTYTTRMFLKQFASGFGLTMGHLLDESTNSHDFWAQCGIMTYDFAKKPTFAALKSVIVLLQDPGTSRTKSRLNYWLSDGSTTNVGHQLLQKNDGTFYLALWLDVSDYNPDTRTVLHPAAQSITINFASAPAAVTEYDFENSGELAGRSVASHSSAARVVLTDRVKFFKIDPGSGGPAPTPPHAPTLSDTAAHWAFNENSGRSAADSVSPATATFSGDVSWTPGVYGASVAIPTGSHLTAPGGVLDTSQSYSVAAWLLLSDATTERTAVAIQGNHQSAFHLGLIANRGFGFEIFSADDTNQQSHVRASQAARPATGGWYHVAGVYDRANCRISLYVNGSFVKSVNGCTTFKATGATEFGRALLGASHPAAWDGAIDEVNFYQRALSASEVSTLAQH